MEALSLADVDRKRIVTMYWSHQLPLPDRGVFKKQAVGDPVCTGFHRDEAAWNNLWHQISRNSDQFGSQLQQSVVDHEDIKRRHRLLLLPDEGMDIKTKDRQKKNRRSFLS